MASAMASSSGCLARASQRVGGMRRCATRPAPFHAAKRSMHLRAAAEDVEGPSVDPAEAEAAVLEAISTAAVEEELVAGSAAEDAAAYLKALSGDAVEVALEYASEGMDASEELTGLLEELAVAEAGNAEEVVVLETQLPSRNPTDEPDILARVDNETATRALEVVKSLKLSHEELKTLVPSDWDTATIDWFTASKKGQELPLPEYKLTFLWMEQNLAVAVDQVYARGQTSPLTEFFFWPRKDSWEELRLALEARPWISETDKIVLLNRLTEVINYWQAGRTEGPNGEAPPVITIDDARLAFPDCSFAGSSSSPPPPAEVPVYAEQQYYQQPEAVAEPTAA